MKIMPKDQNGFTLVEVLVSLTILAVGLLAVAGMQTTAVTGNKTSNDVTVATQLAEEMAERVRTNGGTTPEVYNGMDTSAGCNALADPAKGDCEQWANRMDIDRSGLVDAVGQVAVSADTPITNSATITVTLNWGGGRQVVYTTIMETWGT